MRSNDRLPEPSVPHEYVKKGAGGTASAATTSKLWTATVEATFEADNVEDAAAVAKRLTERVLEHPSVWSVEGYFEDAQVPEVVDV